MTSETNSTSKKKYLIAVVLFVALFAIQFLFSRIGWYIAGLFDCSLLDRDNLFAQVSIHHIVQALCGLVAIFCNRSIVRTLSSLHFCATIVSTTNQFV